MVRGGGYNVCILLSSVSPGANVVHFVYNGTNIRAYKNGVFVNQTSETVHGVTGSGPFLVGGYSTSACLPSGSLMDEFRMYNRALSDAEIALTWNKSLPFGCQTTTGTVTNCCNNTPLVGATVSIGNYITTTGAGGTYAITGIPSGTYNAVCEFPPLYLPVTAQVTITSNQTTQDFCLNPAPPLAIDAGANQIVYYGYPPTECVTLTGSVTGGIQPYTFLWSTGETTQSITVCPTVTTVYTVTIKDAITCTFSDQVKVCVVDIRSRDKKGKIIDKKVQVCHNTSSTTNPHLTIDVGISAVQDHIDQHGDLLGPCDLDLTCPGSK